MTLSTTANKASYSGNGATTSFAFSFKVFASSDLKVYLRDNTTGLDTLQTLTTHYSVTGTLPGTGNVVFVTAPTSNQTVIIVRDNPQTQDFDVLANGPFDSESVELVMDKLAAMVQSIRNLFLTGSAVIDFASVANGAVSAASNVTVTGARVGDFVLCQTASTTLMTTDGVFLFGKVTANDTVEVTVLNMSGSAFDAASQTIFALVLPRVNVGL
jgi:hypothetical protein